MGRRDHDHVAEGLAAFSSAARTLMKIRNIESDSALAEMVDGKARKTINNALAGRHDAQISTLQAIADALDCPLWVMFLVGSSETDLESPARERLIAVVTDYLKCDGEGRHHVESMASAFAAKSRKIA
jgi:transcriptional regulator with XRE-family HTH domain